MKVCSRDVEESNDDLLLCALLFLACHGPREKKAKSLNESTRTSWMCPSKSSSSRATSLARMKGRSVSPLFVKTQRVPINVGLGKFADGHVASLTLGAASQKDYGMSPTTQSKHRSAGELQIVSCTSKKLGRMCATQECRGIPRR